MAGKKILIKGGTLMTLDERRGVFGSTVQGDLLIEGTTIARIDANIDDPDAEVVDASNCLVMPGLIDIHRHVWQTALRGVTHADEIEMTKTEAGERTVNLLAPALAALKAQKEHTFLLAACRTQVKDAGHQTFAASR